MRINEEQNEGMRIETKGMTVGRMEREGLEEDRRKRGKNKQKEEANYKKVRAKRTWRNCWRKNKIYIYIFFYYNQFLFSKLILT